MRLIDLRYQFYWPSWYKIWPSYSYVEYNEDGHYGPTKFGKKYFTLGAFQFNWWSPSFSPDCLRRPPGWEKEIKDILLKDLK